VEKLVPEKKKQCSEFLRHKTTMIHPEKLLEQGIRMRKVVHKPREFVISRAAGYHSGFNSGFNIAEAVNFALSPWIHWADSAKPCLCISDSVRLNINQFKLNLYYKKIENRLPCPIADDVMEQLQKHSEKFF
jgi:DNA damage-responsive transcriptional repressor / [histone H3]-trimethyl-L-lysine36 demethylase